MLRKNQINLIIFITIIASLMILPSNLKVMAKTKTMSITQYESYLKNYSINTAKKAGVSTEYQNSAVDDAKSQLRSFRKLTTKQKKQYISALKTVGTDQGYSTKQIQEISRPLARPSLTNNNIKTKTVSAAIDWKPGKYFPSILQFKNSVTYEVKGKKILRTTKSDNYVLRNFNPFVSLKKTKNERRVSKNRAYTTARWKYVLGVGRYGAHLGNINFSIWGNYKGKLVDFHKWLG